MDVGIGVGTAVAGKFAPFKAGIVGCSVGILVGVGELVGVAVLVAVAVWVGSGVGVLVLVGLRVGVTCAKTDPVGVSSITAVAA